MFTVQYGGRKGRRYSLVISDDLIAVRTQTRKTLLEDVPFSVSAVSAASRRALSEFTLVARFREAGVEILRARVPRRRRALRDRARAVLKREPDIRFAGRVLSDPASNAPVLYTENAFVKFDDDQKPSACQKLLKAYGLSIKREIEYARNAYFVGASEGAGLAIFNIVGNLLKEPAVEFCHPELIRQVRRRAFAQQWHLKRTTLNGQVIDAHANVEAAWGLSDGSGTIIAVIDDGVDLDHEEFRSSGKIVAPRDVTRRNNNPRPGNGDNHGTACAGVACADGSFGASGAAPRARLLPIRLASGLGSQAEADAFIWAAQNGADVISCSWGPEDGDFTDPGDPLHNQKVPLPDSTRLAIDWVIRNGRNGKGCVVIFAAGNGNESVDNDGYASYEKVIAVAACNDVEKKSPYSDHGKAVWCAFPSNNYFPSKTPGIWTTDRSGPVGYNPGSGAEGDAGGNYTNSFGGTSSAAPGVAGVAALILSHNPNSRWDEVKDVIKRSCDRIDTAGGNYGADGHSPLYGYGRVNAKKALELALPAQPDQVDIRTVVRDVRIRDFKTSKLALEVADTKPLKSLRIGVDIEHTYIGDLVVTIAPPAGIGVAPVVLHNRDGGGTDNIKKTYDEVSAPALAAFNGKKPQGTWTLIVQDKDRLDNGKIRSLTLEMRF
ncbi:MAG: S8 family serine peptidase [Deltaproteobacteria bacterium]|nr:S8 family serine peptidase [Deltaproteobacteria bacterium]